MSICNACNLRLESPEEKANHYSTEFHQINAKRRGAELPPVTLAGYKRMQEQQAAEAKAAEEADAEILYICEACNKTFGSEGQFSTHNLSNKHRERVKVLLAERKAARQAEKDRLAAGLPASEPEADVAGGKGGAGEAEDLIIGANNCLFCWADQGDIEGNLRHMQIAHSFYVPDVEFCTEPEGLVEYLHARVIEAKQCLWCTGAKCFESPEATRQHMVDKAHCAMRFETEADFEEYVDYYDYTDDEDEEGEGSCALVLHDSDAMAALAQAGADLPLPGGGVARHRSLMRYHSQNVRAPDERTRSSLRAVMARLSLEYKAAAKERGGRDSHLPVSTRFNLGRGVRGNGTDAAAQRRAQKNQQHSDLANGMWQNKIIRKYLRIQAANALH